MEKANSERSLFGYFHINFMGRGLERRNRKNVCGNTRRN